MAYLSFAFFFLRGGCLCWVALAAGFFVRSGSLTGAAASSLPALRLNIPSVPCGRKDAALRF
jgi:hypothetical protein